MPHDQVEQQVETPPTALEGFVPRLRAYLASMPDARLAYFQPAPLGDGLTLCGPERARAMLVFTRNVSGEHIAKRMRTIRRHFHALYGEQVEFLELGTLAYREACEIAFNAQLAYGSAEASECDRLSRYAAFLEWNASKRLAGRKQESPPALTPAIDRPLSLVSVPKFITPIYRHLKMIDAYLRDLQPLTHMTLHEFTRDSAAKARAEAAILKSVQSAILVTMSVMHRKMRLSARDYRDLFLHMPAFGMLKRDHAMKLAHCAEMRDRLMFQHQEVSAVDVYDNALIVMEVMQDFKRFMLDWLFEHYYASSGELIHTE